MALNRGGQEKRLNATFRGWLHMLVRRGRAIAHKELILTAGMYLVGCLYNPCSSQGQAPVAIIGHYGNHPTKKERNGKNVHQRWLLVWQIVD
ncbi:MAG: hypothetical protein HQL06_16670 [Nitrospirae bacterium]|nr:hypothetical protein [Nitrospirota bacterium]